MITEPGIYAIPNDDYHADPCPTPSASRSILHSLIVGGAPAKIREAHPRLNPNFVADNDRSFDLGSAAHDYLLEGGEKVVVLPFPDYRTKDAKAERDAAISLGKVPILADKFQNVKMMADAARAQISGHADFPGAFQNGKAEQSIFWKEGDIWMRCRPDWLGDDGWIDDYKTTDIESPRRWMESTIPDMGYDLQAYMDMRGYHAVTGKNAKGVRFWVQECKPPFLMYCVVLDETMLMIAEQKFQYGLRIFEKCLKSGKWPGYSNKAYTAFPAFKSNMMFEQIKERETEIETAGGDLFKLMIDMHAPIERKE